MASPEEQNTIQIDSDHKEDCFKQTVIQKYTKEGKKEAMQRVNDCNILKDLKESGTINWYSFTVNTNDNKYEFYKYGDDDFQIYDSNNN